jgi:hypothetical protein
MTARDALADEKCTSLLSARIQRLMQTLNNKAAGRKYMKESFISGGPCSGMIVKRGLRMFPLLGRVILIVVQTIVFVSIATTTVAAQTTVWTSGSSAGINGIATPIPPILSSPPIDSAGLASNPTFSWGASPGAISYELQVSKDSTFSTVAIDTSGIRVLTKTVAGLSYQTKYYWRVRASDASGWGGWSSTWSFTTAVPPAVVFHAPTFIGSTSATLSGIVNPNGSPTTVWFKWGTDPKMQSYDTTSRQTIGSGTSVLLVTAMVSLKRNTTYYYQAVAQNLAGVVTGSTYSFPTASTTLGEYNPDQNCVLLLHLDETSGSIVGDASDYNNNGTATGTTIVDGKVGSARSFASTNDVIAVPASSSTNTLSAITVEAWVYPQATKEKPVLEFNSGSAVGVQLWLSNNSGNTFDALYINFVSTDGTSHIVTSPSSLIVGNTWQHVAGTYDKATGIANLYVNGQLAKSSSIGTFNLQTSYPIYLGKRVGGTPRLNNNFVGYIDEVRISNKARSAQEFNLQLPPTNLQATVAGTAVNLSWQNGGGALGLLRYKIYRGSDSTNLTIIDSVTLRSYSNTGLTPGATYFYQVSAVDSTGFEGGRSNAASSSIGYPPAQTALSSPAKGSANQPTALVLGWNATDRATSYHVQVCLDSTFSSLLLLNDSIVASNSRQMSGLAANSTYYWRVRGKNLSGYGDWSLKFNFSTTASKTETSAGLAFPSNPTASTDYRLVSFPGTDVSSFGQILTGLQNVDWRVFAENGAPLPNNLQEFSAQQTPSVGQGYWLLTKGTFSYSRLATMPTLGSDGMYSIKLGPAWNIIGNPFDVPLTWATVQDDNQTSSTLWTYAGVSGFQTSTTLDPFKGYYFYNSGATQLKLRYPFPSLELTPTSSPAIDWKLQLTLETDQSSDAENYIGISTSSKEYIDALCQTKPPLLFSLGYLYFPRATPSGALRLLSSDFRNSVGEGQVWDFEVSNPRLSRSKIRIVGVETVPFEYSVRLIDEHNSVPIDLRLNREIQFQMNSDRMRFHLVVGKSSFVQAQASKYVPESFELSQNYPNPFNPSTSITYSVPRSAFIKLEILSVLGQRIETLVEANQTPGIYTVVWNGAGARGNQASSGIYFSRLIVDGRIVAVKKMSLLK